LKLAFFYLVIIWQAGEATKIRTTIEIVKRKINVSPLIISNFYNFTTKKEVYRRHYIIAIVLKTFDF